MSLQDHRGHNEKRVAGSSWLRPAVQAIFFLAVILAGWQFRHFVHSLQQPAGAPLAARPAAVEGFLPISALMSLTYLARTGLADRVHPAGLILFTLALASALLLRRGFCAWVCPIGAAAEYLHKIGRLLFGENPNMPVWLDALLQGLKYTGLAFFLNFVLRMPADALGAFLDSPYNRMADVKMYLFFSQLSRMTLLTLILLLWFSLLFKNFWCRYLCPYGALLGLVSLLSPTALRRDTARCTGCGRCSAACPNRIAVHGKARVNSTECTACGDCVQACPAHGALHMTVGLGRAARPVSVAAYGLLLAAAFLVAPRVAGAAHFWRTSTSPEMYRALYSLIDGIGHSSGGTWQSRPTVPASYDFHSVMGASRDAFVPRDEPADSSDPKTAAQ